MWFTCPTPCNYLRKKKLTLPTQNWNCLPSIWILKMYFICYGIRRIADSNCRFESQIRIADSNFRFDQIGTFGLDFQSCIIIFAMPVGSRHTWVIPRTPTPKYESTTLEMLALPMRVCAGLVKVVLCSLRTSSFGGFFKPSRCPFLLETMLLCWLGVSLYRTQDEVYWSVQKSPVCWTLPGYSSSGDRKTRCGRKVT